MRFPFPLTIIPMRLDIDPMVLLIVSSGTGCNVSLTRFEYSSKYSLVMFLLKASACDMSFVMLNIFSIGFMSELLGGMENISAPMLLSATLAFLLFWLGPPSCKRSFYFRFALFSNVSLKCSKINSPNISSLIFPWYCSQSTTHRLNAIVTRKCPLYPQNQHDYLLQYSSNPSLHFPFTRLLYVLIFPHRKGYTCVENIKIESDILCPTLLLQSFFMRTAHFLLALTSFIFKSLFLRVW